MIVLVIHDLDFRLDMNLLVLPPGRFHTFSGSHSPQSTYNSLSHSLGLSLKLFLGSPSSLIHYLVPSSFDLSHVL